MSFCLYFQLVFVFAKRFSAKRRFVKVSIRQKLSVGDWDYLFGKSVFGKIVFRQIYFRHNFLAKCFSKKMVFHQNVQVPNIVINTYKDPALLSWFIAVVALPNAYTRILLSDEHTSRYSASGMWGETGTNSSFKWRSHENTLSSTNCSTGVTSRSDVQTIEQADRKYFWYQDVVRDVGNYRVKSAQNKEHW